MINRINSTIPTHKYADKDKHRNDFENHLKESVDNKKLLEASIELVTHKDSFELIK